MSIRAEKISEKDYYSLQAVFASLTDIFHIKSNVVFSISRHLTNPQMLMIFVVAKEITYVAVVENEV